VVAGYALAGWLGFTDLTDFKSLTGVELALTWGVVVAFRVSQKLAQWETAQHPVVPLSEPPPLPELPIETKTRIRELLTRNRINALKLIRAETGMSLNEAKEYATQLMVDRKCPACAELVKAEATVCRHCGRDLPTLQ
jgi:ribosomal protein L7/L12